MNERDFKALLRQLGAGDLPPGADLERMHDAACSWTRDLYRMNEALLDGYKRLHLKVEVLSDRVRTLEAKHGNNKGIS